MCDVMVALSDATKNGRVLFGKNSDRPKGECQTLHFDPGGVHPAGSEARCSYLSVPRGAQTLGTMGLRPYWCWGYETGINAAGVAGGNAAVFTRHEPSGDAAAGRLGLTGMDLLRLALERGATAEACVGELCTLLERHGQYGSAVAGKGHRDGGYDNAFLFADGREAWVVETSERRWVAERITSGIRTISNELTIRSDFERSSEDLLTEDLLNVDPGKTFDFARAYEDHENYVRQVSHIRQRRTTQLLKEARGDISVETLMRVLRDHYEDTFLGGPSFDRYLPDFHTVCMHDSPAGFTWGDTATSFVAEPGSDSPVWVAYSPPCSSLYLPIAFGEPLPPELTAAGRRGSAVSDPTSCEPDTYSPTSLWWRIHRIVDATAQRPAERLPTLREALDPIERRALDLLSDGQRSDALTADLVAEVLSSLSGLEQRWELG